MNRTGISVIIALIIVMALSYTLPKMQYEPRGILLPIKLSAPIDPSLVKFFDVLPQKYKAVGAIHIVRHFSPDSPSDSQIAEQKVLEKAKELAARGGANAVVIHYFAHSDPTVQPDTLAIYSLNAEAISVEGGSHGS